MKSAYFTTLILLGSILIAPSQESAAPASTPPKPGEFPALEPEGSDSVVETEESDSGSNALELLQRSEKIIATIREEGRQLDPFGLPMDPTSSIENLGIAEQFNDLDSEAPVLNNSALKEALNDLPLSGVYPGKQMIVIGARSFRRGEQFGMQLDELTIRLRLEGIKGQSIYFKDMDTQEVTFVEFNPKPAEFEPITKGSKPPTLNGIVPMNDLFIVN